MTEAVSQMVPPQVVQLPRTTWDQRKSLYKDIEEMVSPGFISHHTKVHKTRFVLRTLNPGDQYMIRMRAHGQEEHEWRLIMVASSIWMLDGISILDLPNRVPWLVGLLRKIPSTVLEVLFTNVLGLFKRAEGAADAVEAFCYEDRTRVLWRSFHEMHPAEHFGIPGLKGIGTNFIQRMWIAFNQMDDRRLDNQNSWEGQKFVASAMADVKKVVERERRMEEQEDSRRQSIRDIYFYRTIGLLPKEDLTGEARRSLYPEQEKTSEDLSDEMRRWVTGEHDWHDKVIEDYKNRITTVKEARAKAREENWKQLVARKQEYHGEDTPASTALVGYTGDQIQSLVAKRNPGQRKNIRYIPSGQEVQQDELYRKYVGRELSPGLLRVKDDQIVGEGQTRFDGDNVVFVQEGSEIRVLPQGQQPSLQEQVAGRQVQFHDGSDER